MVIAFCVAQLSYPRRTGLMAKRAEETVDMIMPVSDLPVSACSEPEMRRKIRAGWRCLLFSLFFSYLVKHTRCIPCRASRICSQHSPCASLTGCSGPACFQLCVCNVAMWYARRMLAHFRIFMQSCVGLRARPAAVDPFPVKIGK